MITKQKLDSLNDKEILVMDMILKHKGFGEICQFLHLFRDEVHDLTMQVYTKLDIWPRRAASLRKVWKHSILAYRVINAEYSQETLVLPVSQLNGLLETK